MSPEILFTREALPHLPALRHFASSLCRDPQRSDDLVQDTMLKAWRSFHTYKAGTNCRAWLFQICKHSFINDYRRSKYEPLPVDLTGDPHGGGWGDEDEGREIHPVVEGGESPDEQFADEVSLALEALPLDYQTAVLLNDLEGYTYEEIAAFARVPVGTIRSRIHRGRKLLASRLEGYAARQGYHSAPPARREDNQS